jgi:hypothetical protein
MGASDEVNAMIVRGDELLVTGDFTTAGGLSSQYFAIWHFPPILAHLEVMSFGNYLLNWNTESNRTYQIYSTTNLFEPFTPFGGPISSAGTNTSFTNAGGSQPNRFFRIQEIVP